tara:strand:- start:2273 stop:3007 length:735 start_codon:yes stop_codon:yes gene_type:complete
MNTLGYILTSTIIVSLISLIGVFTLALNKKRLNKILIFLISLSAGTLIGGAFLHLIPESVEEFGSGNIFIYVLIGFILFYIIEKVLHWRHCHDEGCHVHTFSYMNLVGDSIHNFIDGLIIAASFIVSIPLGISTSIAVALHEIPQEIGDFGVLVHGGYKTSKALMMNLLTALTAVIGGVIGYYVSGFLDLSIIFLLPFAAGGFIYISASDLIPEIRKELDLKKSLINLIIFILGIAIMYGLRFV